MTICDPELKQPSMIRSENSRQLESASKETAMTPDYGERNSRTYRLAVAPLCVMLLRASSFKTGGYRVSRNSDGRTSSYQNFLVGDFPSGVGSHCQVFSIAASPND